MLTSICDLAPGISHVRVVGKTLRSHWLGQLSARLRDANGAGANAVLFDFSGVRAVDYSGAGALLDLAGQAMPHLAVGFCDLPARSKSIFAESGLDRCLPIYDHISSALSSDQFQALAMQNLRVLLLQSPEVGLSGEAGFSPDMLEIQDKTLTSHALSFLVQNGLRQLAIPAPLNTAAPLQVDPAHPIIFSPNDRKGDLQNLVENAFLRPTEVLVMQSNTLPDFKLVDMLAQHRKGDAAATFAASRSAGRTEIGGVALVKFDQLPALGARDLPSLFDAMARHHLRAELFETSGARRVETAASFFAAAEHALSMQIQTWGQSLGTVRIAPCAKVSKKAKLKGACFVGAGAVIEAGAELQGPVIVGRDCHIEGRVLIRDCVLAPGTLVQSGAWLDGLLVGNEWSFDHRYANAAGTQIADQVGASGWQPQFNNEKLA